ncbi:MAG TPA: hypothetical protein PLV65_02270 [Tenuifilaceae bacterium]|nr:hypothetical protein [Tenuifilaceae bacterium]HPQ35702.1 hypothetical protein [Tenuifilaceae bacterium]
MSSQQFKIIIISILLPALGLLYFNSIYFRHQHQLSIGNIIYHAHPFDKDTEDCSNSPIASHHHSDEEYLILDTISNLIVPVLTIILAVVFAFKKLIQKFIIDFDSEIYPFEKYSLQQYRGPPAF